MPQIEIRQPAQTLTRALRRHRSQVEADNLREERLRAALTLERLRYQQYERSGTLSDFMQRLGDWGRQFVAVVRFRL